MDQNNYDCETGRGDDDGDDDGDSGFHYDDYVHDDCHDNDDAADDDEDADFGACLSVCLSVFLLALHTSLLCTRTNGLIAGSQDISMRRYMLARVCAC